MDVNLILFKKNGSQKVFPLPSSITVIGRRHDCDLRIPLMPVSRRHCQLSLNNETLNIRDLGSRNGTYLNGKRVDKATVQPGDYIKIGPLTFALQINGQPKEIVPPKHPLLPSQEGAGAPKPPQPEKPKTEAAEKELPDSFLELATADEKALPAVPDSGQAGDEFPELDLDEADDSFLADLEDI